MPLALSRLLLGLGLVVAPPAVMWVGGFAAIVFAHGAWESNMNSCVEAAALMGGPWIEWSWRDMGFICHPDGSRDL